MGIVDMKGQKIERLFVIKYHGNDKHGNALWECLCDCGNTKIALGAGLRKGGIKSCGCLNKEINLQRITKHGHAIGPKPTLEYKTWQNMLSRCNNPKATQYENYGGRGIDVCNRWKDFRNFFEDMGEKPGREYQIDRIDNNKGYCKENCEWATHKEQMRNTRRNRYVTEFGVTRICKDWISLLEVSHASFYYHLDKGRSISYIANHFKVCLFEKLQVGA
jgi:hypothetical protein